MIENINLFRQSDITNYSDIYTNYDIKKNISKNNITKYEYTKLLGIRTLQIATGTRL